VFATAKAAVPAADPTALSAGETTRTGWVPDCEMVTRAGLPVAPAAVTVIVATRDEGLGFAV